MVQREAAFRQFYTRSIPMTTPHWKIASKRVTRFKFAFYADDSAYFTSSRPLNFAARRMQVLLDSLPERLHKTGAFMITRATPLARFTAGRDWRTVITYLGYTINSSLSLIPQVDHTIRSTRAAQTVLRPVLALHLPTWVKLDVYKSHMRSRFTYTAPA